MSSGQAPSEARPIRRLGYEPALDGVRGVAILLILGHHARDLPAGGGLGVTAFFVFSGFLITALLVQEWHLRGSISLRGFFRRRALRLLPALFVYCAAYLVVALVLTVEGSRSWEFFERAGLGALYGLTYVSNVMIAWTDVPVPIGIGHLWSLATQEQFYVLWPPLLVLLLRRRIPTRLVVGSLIAGALAIVAWRIYLVLAGASIERVHFAPDANFDAILIGCVLGYLFVVDRLPRLLTSPRFLQAASIVAMVGALPIIFLHIEYELMKGALLFPFVLAVAVIVLAAALHRGSLANRLLRLPPLIWTGRISYSLYLWQQLFIFTLRDEIHSLPVMVALSFAAATVSYFLVERPFLKKKKRARDVIDQQAAGLESSPPRPRDPGSAGVTRPAESPAR